MTTRAIATVPNWRPLPPDDPETWGENTEDGGALRRTIEAVRRLEALTASPAPAAEGGLRAYNPECDSGDCILPRGHAEDHWDGHGHWPRVSPAAEGPWVVRVLDRDADADKTKTWWDAGGGISADRTNAVRYAERASAVGAATWFERAGYITTVLPLAEAERAEKEGPLRTSYPHGAVVAPQPDAADLTATLRREECERKAARQATPAGWVVRGTLLGGSGSSAATWSAGVGRPFTGETEQRRVYSTRAEAVMDSALWAETAWDTEILPVDAAGNVIEAAAWEASRSYEEAERLRAELATWKRTAEQRMERIRSVKAERDDRSARCDAAETDVARLTKERDSARAERDTAKAERDRLTTDEADLRYALRQIAGLVGGPVALGASTEMHCKVADEVRAVVGQPGKVPDAVQLAVRANIADDRLAVHDERLDNVHARLAAIEHRAPVVRDHSEVIAQCEEALRLCSLRGKDDALLAALAALRGAP